MRPIRTDHTLRRPIPCHEYWRPFTKLIRKATLLTKRSVLFYRTMNNFSTTVTSLFLILVWSCGQRGNKNDLQRERTVTADTVIINCDSIYEGTGYFVRLVSFDSLLDKEHNAILLFGQKTNGGPAQIYIDTVYSNVRQVEFSDYNNDNIKDILVQNISDAGSNWTYNLFLTDLKARTLRKVKGFEEIKNPKVNKDLGVIESHVSSGTNYIEFYRLVDNDSIFKYDILVYDSADQTSEKNYKLALEKIRRE